MRTHCQRVSEIGGIMRFGLPQLIKFDAEMEPISMCQNESITTRK